MTRLYLLAAVIALTACNRASAASLIGVPNGNAIAIFLEGGSLNGQFDTVGLDAHPLGAATFLNIDSGLVAGVPRGPGEQFTYWNRDLGESSVTPGGLGWSLVGIKVLPTEVSFAGTILAHTIDTSIYPGGRAFLANVLPSQAGQVQGSAVLVRAGNTMATLNLTIVPEPASIGLTFTALLCLAGIRRRFIA